MRMIALHNTKIMPTGSDLRLELTGGTNNEPRGVCSGDPERRGWVDMIGFFVWASTTDIRY
jgi:hypothetical protein